MRRLLFILFAILSAMLLVMLSACSESGTENNDGSDEGDGDALPPLEIFIPSSESRSVSAAVRDSSSAKRAFPLET